MRPVLDTNVVLSGLFWQGAAHALIKYARAGTLSLVTSPELLAELADVQALAEVIRPAALPRPVCRDPDDDAVLAVAPAGTVDLIVSGDTDLLDLKAYQTIPIVTPAEALSMMRIP